MTRRYRRPDQVEYEVLDILNNSKTLLKKKTRSSSSEVHYGMLGKNKLVIKSGLGCSVSMTHFDRFIERGVIRSKSIGSKNFFCITDTGVNRLNQLSKKFKPLAPQDTTNK